MSAIPKPMPLALWLDPFARIASDEIARLAAAGLQVMPVRTLADLREAASVAQLAVVRVRDDVSLLTDVVEALAQSGHDGVPVVCRVERDAFQLAIDASQRGAAFVVAAEDFSFPSWRRLLGGGRRGDAKPFAASAALAGSAGSTTSTASTGSAPSTASIPSTASAASSPITPRPITPRAFVFVDPVSQQLLALAQRVAQAEIGVLLTGPTGAGKEVLAKVLHEASPRRNGPFVALNCAAVPDSLIEELLFGHERGVFTGAHRERAGLFEQAAGGTLFLDEIGEMPAHLQTRLLRVIQEREVLRLGSNAPIKLDFRLIAATHKDLKAAIATREFREDLYFRISAFRLRVPPLAERRGDILPLVAQLILRHAPVNDRPQLSQAAERALVQYDWPGNVRELENVVQRALVLCQGGVIGLEHLLFDDACDPVAYVEPQLAPPAPAAQASETHPNPLNPGLHDAVRESEYRVILAAIESSASREEAARKLGISPRTLRYKLAQWRERSARAEAAVDTAVETAVETADSGA